MKLDDVIGVFIGVALLLATALMLRTGRADAMTVHEGDYVLTADNPMVSDLIITGQLRATTSNVFVENVTADSFWQQRPHSGATITNSSFVGDDPADGIGAVVQPDTLIDNVTIKGHKDGLYIETGGSVTVRDSFIDITSDLPDNHADGVTLPFAQNFNGTADFLIEATTIWAEGKTAAFNQQALPITVVDSVWSGSTYAALGSSYQGFAQNPDDVRLFGRPSDVSTLIANGIAYDVLKIPEPALGASVAAVWALIQRRSRGAR